MSSNVSLLRLLVRQIIISEEKKNVPCAQGAACSDCSQQADVPGRWRAGDGEPIGAWDLERLGEGLGSTRGLWLATDGNEWYRYFILIDPSVPLSDMDRAMIGGISIESMRGGGWTVGSVTARHGYGPILYGLAMDHAVKNGGVGLTKNVSGNTSPAASRVWDRFKSDPTIESDVIDGREFFRSATGTVTALPPIIELSDDELEEAKDLIRGLRDA